jgi:hypothetical protein
VLSNLIVVVVIFDNCEDCEQQVAAF